LTTGGCGGLCGDDVRPRTFGETEQRIPQSVVRYDSTDLGEPVEQRADLIDAVRRKDAEGASLRNLLEPESIDRLPLDEVR
jgi:hypothetical protein